MITILLTVVLTKEDLQVIDYNMIKPKRRKNQDND